MSASDPQLVESIYAATLDPAKLEVAVQRWIDSFGGAGIESPGAQALDAEGHMDLAASLLERLADEPTIERSTPLFELDARGRVSACNKAAETIYRVPVPCDLRDLPLDDYSQAEIERSLKRRPPVEEAFGRRLILAHRTDRPTRVLVLLEAGDEQFLLATTEVLWTTAQDSLLQDSFELTDAEIDVVKHLSEGHGVEQVAESRGASMNTVRAQIRKIYEKTAVNSMPELVHLMVGLSAASYEHAARREHDQSNSGDSGPYPRMRQRRVFKLGNDRRLDFSEFGADGGKPVVFLHDEICIDGWTAAGVGELKSRGLRVIAPLRPCYGRSDPLPPGVNAPSRQNAEDVLELMDELAVERAVILARVIGNPTALYLLNMAPERVQGVVSVAPPLPISDEMFRKLNPLLRAMLFATKHSETMARYVVKARFAYANRYGIDRFLASHYRDPRDQKLIDDPEVHGAITLGMSAASARGVDGYLSDIRGMSQYTTASMTELIRAPLTIVLGQHDRNHRKERALAMIEAGAKAELLELPDASELVFYRHTDVILDRVARYSAN